MAINPYLFAYGTLVWGRAEPGIQSWVKGWSQRHGEGSVAGRLYDMGPYPGATPSVDPRERVHGVVLRLREPSRVLERLDRYEGYWRQAPRQGWFRREETTVLLNSGERIRSWIYWVNRVPSGAERLVEGVYRQEARGLLHV